jgi:PTH1 family peptidyl-tRNA hydrolase
MKIIFAQGNLEPDYSKTRHNIGFEILNTLAAKNNLTWVKKPKFNAETTELSIDGEKTILVKPTTYYNETGTSIRKIIDFYKIDIVKDLLVIHDDLALDFGIIRIREQGSDAGNNGIKSINSHLDDKYTRIRIGISNELRPQIDDAQFVTSKFNQPEHQKLEKDIIPQVIESIHDFCKGNLKITSYKITE